MLVLATEIKMLSTAACAPTTHDILTGADRLAGGQFLGGPSPVVPRMAEKDVPKVRQGRLHDLLESLGVSVWFSEKDVALGTPLLREIDRGLAKSRVGIVLVTPALLRRLQGRTVL
jgi:hypothetical protein